MGYEPQPIGMPAAWAPSRNSYVWAAMCPAAQESTPAQHLRGLGWQRGHAGVPQKMGITAEAAEAVAWAHHLLLMLPWSSTGAGGPGAVLQLGDLYQCPCGKCGGLSLGPW